MDNRGKIRNRKIMKQLRDFSGLKFGTKTPTDIDGYLHSFGKNEIFIFIEIKHQAAKMPQGQRIAFERLVDIVGEKRKAIFVIGTHCVDSDFDIDVSKCIVKECRLNKKWIKPRIETTVWEIIDWFIRKGKEQ